ncbi:hypothetical protein NUU61_002179 [Penicillium alfredii]|uniref:Uncharacterized protein n=1 Tax=Penicillium alfredii TaxID=1506179 RepID=A0A9W9FR72_9EURO|nr:uncharacterized protein NUU61_002179 [Penicillium alfredii]KAJ5104832.1 hypothetical protein NUU61_002179 [Penicillium alfredii]
MTSPPISLRIGHVLKCSLFPRPFAMADPPSIARGMSAPLNTLRRRGIPSRAATFADGANWPSPRRNSTLSDSISEARNSIRSSTDDLFLPRVPTAEAPLSTDESHWHSAPLALALLPAIAGVFFHDGSSFVTDVTLLVLAAIFLNWSVRLPWDWYRSAQAVRQEDSGFQAVTDDTIEIELEEDEATDAGDNSQQHKPSPQHTAATSASKELQIHELAALASCFVFPAVGSWLLHAIRSSLSRPSEGLVSNYNLTIFLLASEVRPVAHLLKLVQARTLHLQRVAASASFNDPVDPGTVQDLTKRLEELEAHVAETTAVRLASSMSEPTQSPSSPHGLGDSPALAAQAVAEARQALQPDIEALNRAMRRYEKRTAVTALQTDTRLQQLEAQTRDAIALAAAAQRSIASRRPSYAFTLIDWACACLVVPAQLALSIFSLPGRVASRCLLAARRMLGRPAQAAPQPRSKKAKGKAPQGYADSQLRSQSPPPRRAPALLPLSRQSAGSVRVASG